MGHKVYCENCKAPRTAMDWNTFSGEKGRAELYFLPQNMTMNGSKYL